jgi:hypothetical protein
VSDRFRFEHEPDAEAFVVRDFGRNRAPAAEFSDHYAVAKEWARRYAAKLNAEVRDAPTAVETAEPVEYLTIAEFVAKHPGKFSASHVSTVAKRGLLPHVRLGSRILIPSNALDVMLARQDEEARKRGERMGAVDARPVDGAASTRLRR